MERRGSRRDSENAKVTQRRDRNFAWRISVAFKRLSGRHKSMGRGVGQIRTAFFVP